LVSVIPLATVSGALPELGLIAVASLAACAMLLPAWRRRALAILGALVLAPLLLLAEVWRSPQLHIVHHHPLWAAGVAVIALGAVGALAMLIVRRAWLTAPLALAALPFRLPIESGGTTSNLLVPLYFVIAGAAVAEILRALRPPLATADGQPPADGVAIAPADGAAIAPADGAAIAPADGAAIAPAGEGIAPAGGRRAAPRLAFEWLLAGYLVLYAIQAAYSVDFEKALQNVVFFYVPFALLYVLLRDLRWERRLIARCLWVLSAFAVLFAVIGFVEYATRHLLFNSKLIASNNVHTYFTVNSVFFDPNIFGRFLALTMVLLAALLIHSRIRWHQLGATIVLGILWAGLLLTLSRSSFGALLVGLGTLAALRWRVWPVLAAGASVIVIGLVALAITPDSFGLNQGLNGASSGRANLITGGGQMLVRRPVWGYGSGSFVREYRREHPALATGVSASHTIPVTIAAEQGLIGLLVYLALVLSALFALLRGARGDPARSAIAATFLALVFHTMLYANFLEDPSTWVLLAAGAVLALGARSAARRARDAAPSPPAVRAAAGVAAGRPAPA
jgi:putative inorganic carbon (HCO3(-)) transporter